MGSETRHRKHAGPANRQGETQFTTKTEVPPPLNANVFFFG